MSINDNMSKDQIEFLERMGVTANFLQVLNYLANMEDLSNGQLMKALQMQNSEYLEKILKKQDEILDNLSEIIDKIKKI